MFTFEHGILIHWFWLKAYMPCSQYEGKCCKNTTIYTANDGQWIGPSNAAQAQLEAIRFWTAYFPEIIWIPTEWKCYATNDHTDCCFK